MEVWDIMSCAAPIRSLYLPLLEAHTTSFHEEQTLKRFAFNNEVASKTPVRLGLGRKTNIMYHINVTL